MTPRAPQAAESGTETADRARFFVKQMPHPLGLRMTAFEDWRFAIETIFSYSCGEGGRDLFRSLRRNRT